MSPSPSVPSVGRIATVILAFVVIACVAMIGGTGYLKYQLDRAETLLAAPDNALGSDQDLFDRLRRNLGYGGFLGLAQNYATAHDASGFSEMKAQIKSADEIAAHLPDKTPAETRHELTAMVAAFDAALQKISGPVGENNGEFTTADLAPLYAALPILDARVNSANAETRLAAQNRMQFWAMLLTLVSWISLIVAAACAAGIYLTLRDKHSAPMRALAQSIQNMARGDMRTAIWGTERQDMIGELARAVDIARYHFSHLPDLSVLSEQGPVRMRFEGGSRSLFEAMMKTISRDSENIRMQSSSLTDTVQHQKEAIVAMSGKVDAVLQSIAQHGQSGDKLIRQAINEMVGSAEGLRNAHAHAADQLNRMIPTLQERAQGLAEIAQLTGKQIGQTLQSLAVSETGLRVNAEQAKNTLVKLSSTADDLGERMFGAINLLQASGKVLAETTQSIKSGLGVFPAGSPEMLAPLAKQLDGIAEQLENLQVKLAHDADANDSHAAAIEEKTVSANDAVVNTLTAHFVEISDQLADLQSKLEEEVKDKATLAAALEQNNQQNNAGHNEEIVAALTAHFEEVSRQLEVVQAKLDEQTNAKPTLLAALEQNIQQNNAGQNETIVAALTANFAEVSSQLALVQTAIDENSRKRDAEQENPARKMALALLAGQLEQVTRQLSVLQIKLDEQADAQAGISGVASSLERNIQAASAEQKQAVTAALTQHFDEWTQQLAALHAKLGDQAGAQSQIAVELGQTLDRKTAENEAVVVAALSSLQERVTATTTNLPTQLSQVLAEHLEQYSPKKDIALLAERISTLQLLSEKNAGTSPELMLQLKSIEQMLSARIESSYESVDKFLRTGIEDKLLSVQHNLATTRQVVEATQGALGKTEVKHDVVMPPELQKQMLDGWFQMSAQIEASRASLVEAIAQQLATIETRLGGKPVTEPMDSSINRATQRQLDQQTQILSELVAALSVLDAHMQQIAEEAHTATR